MQSAEVTLPDSERAFRMRVRVCEGLARVKHIFLCDPAFMSISDPWIYKSRDR